MKVTREDVVLAALAPAKCGGHEPVHVQKLLFLVDEQLHGKLGGRHFAFKAYDYGPYDRGVYDVLEALATDGLVAIGRNARGQRSYSLTKAGQKRGEDVLRDLPAEVKKHMETLSKFVRGLGFAELVSAVYKAYPAMRANSVFRE